MSTSRQEATPRIVSVVTTFDLSSLVINAPVNARVHGLIGGLLRGGRMANVCGSRKGDRPVRESDVSEAEAAAHVLGVCVMCDV